MEPYMKQTLPPTEVRSQVLQLPDDKEVTLTFAGADRPALKTAKEILIQHSVKKLINKGII